MATTPSFVAAAVANSTGTTSITVNKPAGTLEGHVMDAVLFLGALRTVTAPEGWTKYQEIDVSTVDRFQRYWKPAGASEPASYTWSWSTTTRVTASIRTYKDASTVNPIDAQAVAVDNNFDGWYRAPSINLISTDVLLIPAYAVGINTNPTIGPPSGFLERVDTGDNFVVWHEVSDKAVTGPGATGQLTGSGHIAAGKVGSNVGLVAVPSNGSIVGSGGGVVGGTASLRAAAAMAASGGTVLGGASAFRAHASLAGSAGPIVGGEATFLQYQSKKGTGGGVVGGAARFNRSAIFFAKLGAIVGGSARFYSRNYANLNAAVWFANGLDGTLTIGTRRRVLKYPNLTTGKLFEEMVTKAGLSTGVGEPTRLLIQFASLHSPVSPSVVWDAILRFTGESTDGQGTMQVLAFLDWVASANKTYIVPVDKGKATLRFPKYGRLKRFLLELKLTPAQQLNVGMLVIKEMAVRHVVRARIGRKSA